MGWRGQGWSHRECPGLLDTGGLGQSRGLTCVWEGDPRGTLTPWGPDHRRVALSNPAPESVGSGRALPAVAWTPPGSPARSCIFYQGGGSGRSSPVTAPLLPSFSRLFQRTHAATSLASCLSLQPPVLGCSLNKLYYFLEGTLVSN